MKNSSNIKEDRALEHEKLIKQNQNALAKKRTKKVNMFLKKFKNMWN